jgi:hypothetical protein
VLSRSRNPRGVGNDRVNFTVVEHDDGGILGTQRAEIDAGAGPGRRKFGRPRTHEKFRTYRSNCRGFPKLLRSTLRSAKWRIILTQMAAPHSIAGRSHAHQEPAGARQNAVDDVRSAVCQLSIPFLDVAATGRTQWLVRGPRLSGPKPRAHRVQSSDGSCKLRRGTVEQDSLHDLPGA